MTKDEALKMAIEQIKHLIEIYIPSPEWSGTAVQEECYETINACKKALEQPAQEDVPILFPKWDTGEPVEMRNPKETLKRPSNMVAVPLDKLQDMQRRLKALDTKQVCEAQEPIAFQFDDLTEEYIADLDDKTVLIINGGNRGHWKDKLYAHPAPQPAQDYVLICKRCGDDLGLEYVPNEQPAQEPVTLIKHENGNYSPKHQWQGLTDDEIRAIDDITLGDYYVEKQATDFARAIEQALNKKNT
jgi:hypothetical protein